MIEQFFALTVGFDARESEEVLVRVDVEHAVEGGALEATACSVDCFQGGESVEGEFVGSDFDCWAVDLVELVDGSGA